MTCPASVKNLYVNMIYHLHSATIESVPAIWRDEVQAEIDRVSAEEAAAMEEKLSKLEEAREKLEGETKSST